MDITKATNREKKQFKRKHGMRTSGKSVFVIQNTIEKRAKKIRKGK